MMAAAATPRPLDQVGAATAPIPFPPPQVRRGTRRQVRCIHPETGNHDVLDNALMRRQKNIQQAYWKIPTKHNMDTIMGHVEFCLVLRRVQHEGDDMVFEYTNQMVAVKVNYTSRMDHMRGQTAEDPLQEVAAMQLLGDDPIHVLGAMDVLFDEQSLCIVMRYCRSGDLFDKLIDSQNRADGRMTEDESRFWFCQLVHGVHFLHSRGICHRDLSPENFMIDENQGLIIDMGMCLRIPYQGENGEPTSIENAHGPRFMFGPLHPSGKLRYMSPEIFESRRPFDGHAIDVWTCGTILFCWSTYERSHRDDRIFRMMTEDLRGTLQGWNVNLSDGVIDLLQGMLTVNARDRITMEEIMGHPWFALNPLDQAVG